MKINLEKFETILLRHWTEFIDVRELLSVETQFVKTHLNIDGHIKQLTISRFELTDHGFIIWIECSLKYLNKFVNITSEIFLHKNGDLEHIKSIR